MPPQRAVPIVLDMVEPVRRLDHRRPFAGHRVGEPGAVARAAIADLLRRQRFGRRDLRLRALFLVDAPAPACRRLAIFALERAVERRLAVEPDGDKRCSRYCPGHNAACSLQCASASARNSASAARRSARRIARRARSGRPRLRAPGLDLEILGIALVDDRKRPRNRRVGKALAASPWNPSADARHNRGSPAPGTIRPGARRFPATAAPRRGSASSCRAIAPRRR